MGINKKPNLTVIVGSLKLQNPLIIVSGVFGYGDEFNKIEGFNNDDAGAVVLKGVSLKPWQGNPTPRIIETASGMLNSIGLQNIGVQKLVQDKLPLWENSSAKVIVNVVGTSVEEYVEVSRIAAASKIVDAIELNLSCPNISKGGIAFGTDTELIKRITSDTKNAVPEIPLWVKLTPNVEKIEPLALAAVGGGADAVSLINTVKGTAIDIYSGKPKLANNIGGLSGPAIKPIALLKVAEVAKAFAERGISLPIIGIGGVLDYSDVMEFIIAGASAVGIGTSLFYDPFSLSRIKREINSFLLKQYQLKGDEKFLSCKNYIGTLNWNIEA